MASVEARLGATLRKERVARRLSADAIFFEENLFPIFGEHSEGFQVKELR